MVLGDPGLLSNLVFKPSSEVKYRVGVVVHYVDEGDRRLKSIAEKPGYLLINPLNTPQQVVKDITSCQLVLSSSLHGLIIADSFGVPNYWMPLSDKVVGGSYKFEDYYSPTERTLVKKSLAILGDNQAIEEAIKLYQPVKNLKKLQRGLIRSFPF